MHETRLSDLTVQRIAVNDVNIVVAEGECDICSVQLLKDAMTEVISEGHKELVVDVKNVKYIDSSGLAAILWARHKIEENDGRLVISGLNGRLSTAFNALGGMLAMAPSVAEALALVNGGKRRSNPKSK